MEIANSGDLLVVSEKGIGKRTDIKQFPKQKRAGSGVKAMQITAKTEVSLPLELWMTNRGSINFDFCQRHCHQIALNFYSKIIKSYPRCNFNEIFRQRRPPRRRGNLGKVNSNMLQFLHG